MFDRLKKVFASSPADAGAEPMSVMSEWAGTRGFSYSGVEGKEGFALKGSVGGRPWRMERGRASRDYIRGEELRARAELKLSTDSSILIMNRPLKDALEKRAYEMYTDTLQTTADPSLPEEMRWLAMYPEVGWTGLPDAFWTRYAVMAEDKNHAVAWIDKELAARLLSWPEPATDMQVPLVLMMMRGKAYLRMQFTPDSVATLEHAADTFTLACENAIKHLSTDIAL